MSGLIAKLAQGLGAGLQTYGAGTVEQQRLDRLEKLKRDSAATQNKVTVSEGDLDRKSREKIAGMKTVKNDWINVTEEEDKYGTKTGNFTGQNKNGDWVTFDKEANVFKPMGTGVVEEAPKETPDFKSVAEGWADSKASLMPFSDSSDFKELPEGMKTEEAAAGIFRELAEKAHKDGVYDKFIERMGREDSLKYLATMYKNLKARRSKTYSGKVTQK